MKLEPLWMRVLPFKRVFIGPFYHVKTQGEGTVYEKQGFVKHYICWYPDSEFLSTQKYM